MFQIRLQKDNDWMEFGPEFKTIDECTTVVALLDFLTLIDQLPPYAKYYTRMTEVRAVEVDDDSNPTGPQWNWHEGDPTGMQASAWEEI